ncbi:MAG: hypothetical protein QNJ51_13715 [Calothrix sp. MO_167.B12]|nr:hypothetical protein [Calothrix sp. MO_167.B12]
MPNHNDANQIVRRFKNLVEQTKDVNKSYIQLADRYLTLKRPLFGKDFYKDIDQYQELIYFCLVIQDKYFLDKWGNPGHHKNRANLAESVNTYIKYFNSIRQNQNVPPKVREYLSYLVERILRPSVLK